MKVWFGATSLEIEKYINVYRKITQYLVERDCIILFDWIEDAYAYKLSHPNGKRQIKHLYNQILAAINNADISVIEYTVPNFSSSHQIIYSIHKHKPTLVLRLYKENSFADSYLDALESEYLTVRSYHTDNYREVIDEFLGESQIGQGLKRYNVVLDKKHKYYLDWVAAVKRKSRSETIRTALDQLIAADLQYKGLLSHKK